MRRTLQPLPPSHDTVNLQDMDQPQTQKTNHGSAYQYAERREHQIVKLGFYGVLTAVAFALFLSGCSSPTSPVPVFSDSPRPVSVHVVDGTTGQPVTATVGTGSYSAPGYLTREQRSGDVFLWPAPDPAYVQTLAYGEFSLGGRLNTWTGGAFVSCGLDRPEIQATLALMTAVTGIQQGTGTCNVTWEINPADPALATGGFAGTYRTWQGYGISSARVVFRDAGAISNSLPHEGGHILGLGHAGDRASDLMYAFSDRRASSFSARELVQLNMMYRHRAAGNSWPDREPN